MNAKEQSNMEKEQEILNVETSIAQDSPEVVIEKVVAKVDVIATTLKGNKRILQGKVISNKGDKTIVIKVERQVAHPIYKKYYKKTNKFMAHDETNNCNEGDVVKIRECRPLSKRKCWEVVDVVERAK